MARLIDADRLLRDPYFQEDRWPESHLIRMAVREQRTVDAVEVIRCKDCKYRKKQVCANPSAGMWVGVELRENDYCSYGERKTDG